MSLFSAIKQYERELSKNGIILETIPESDNLLTIEIIEVPERLHNQGIGSKIMRNLCNYADKNDIVLQLRPAASSTHSRGRLIKFYSKFGFIINKGENLNDKYQYMYRIPKEEMIMQESIKFVKKILKEANLNEKLLLKNWDLFGDLVCNAYLKSPDFEQHCVSSWEALNKSNYVLFKRLLSKVNIIFITNGSTNINTIKILGKEYKIIHEDDEPYETAEIMKNEYNSTGILKISIDYSDHPLFSLEDNIVFRTVHDFIVHILGNHEFGLKGEIAAYNNHAKVAPPTALPALFTEVVGQACVRVKEGAFPKQKITFLYGFDYINVGEIDNDNYEIIGKELIRKEDISIE